MRSTYLRSSCRSRALAAPLLVHVAVACAIALLANACGGAQDTDLFGGSAPASGPREQPDATTPDPIGEGERDAGVIGEADGTTPSPGDGGKEAGVKPDGSPGDGGKDSGADAGRDSGGGTNEPGTIRCGKQKCALATQECCRTRGLGGDPAFSCTGKGLCAVGLGSPLTIPCDDAADCPIAGNLCCFTVANPNSNPVVTDVRCRAAADCNQFDRNNLCDPGLPKPQACPFSGPTESCKQNASESFDFYMCIQ